MSAIQISDTAEITWNASRHEHPARAASWQAMDAVARRDKNLYISLYAPGGVMHDPVGRSSIDPTGLGHRGHNGIAKFWDEHVAIVSDWRFVVHKSFATGDHAANAFTIHFTRPDAEVMLECIFVYQISDSGLLLYVGGYWEMPQAGS